MREIVAVVLYLCAAFLTFGHVYNAGIRECQQERYPEICERYTGPTPVAAGAFWPAYWAARGAIEVTG